MKHTSPVFALIALFLFGCGDSEKKPSTKDYEKQFAVQIPAYFELSSFDVEASENVGSKVEPFYKARFKATVKLKTKTFELASHENEATFIRPVADDGETKEIYGMAGARLSAGNWKIDFNLENNPIPNMGHPKDFFTGGRVILVGTAEETEFKAQQDQKRLAAEQEAEKAQKARQLEEEKQNAERERKANELAAERERKGKTLAAELDIKRKTAELEQAKKDEERRILRETSYENIAREADITASSEYSMDYRASYAADGVIGTDGPGEWASKGQVNGAWLNFSWPTEVEINRVVIYDRPNTTDLINQATLRFSDGTTLNTGSLPNDGAARELNLAPRKINWMRFEVVSGAGQNVGVSEIQVYGRQVRRH
jgi:hypothetical protein